MSVVQREQMDVVVAGHVDHGKSTVIGRLLADSGSLPEGKLEQVKAFCARNARPFEYAFLLDALKEEQAQGITIDCARAFFHSDKRDYILTDAPGHAAFLKNMVTGAARAEAALLVIDAQEGVQENTRRHGHLLSLLGVRQLVVLVNKMDLVGFDKAVFERLKAEYSAFLSRLGFLNLAFVPVAAMSGDNIVHRAAWHDGPTALESLDAFTKPAGREGLPFRFPVQDIYKFTEDGDDRRILAGTVEAGRIKVGEEVLFHPSGQRSRLQRIEIFNASLPEAVQSGAATGFTLVDEPFLRPGEMMSRAGEPPPRVSRRFRVNLFWMGRSPLVQGKKYKLKLGAARAAVRLTEVLGVLDASDLVSVRNKVQVDRHDVAECVLETSKPVAFDLASEIDATGRFVLVDDFEIGGGGVILEALDDHRSELDAHVLHRETEWERGAVASSEREAAYGHKPKFILLVGKEERSLRETGRAIERRLFDAGHKAYFLSPLNMDRGLDADVGMSFDRRGETLRRLGETARLMTDGGLILISSLAEADADDVAALRTLTAPHAVLVAACNGPAPSGTDLDLSSEPDADARARALLDQLRREAIFPDFAI